MSDSMISTSLPPCTEYTSDPDAYQSGCLPGVSVPSEVEVAVATWRMARQYYYNAKITPQTYACKYKDWWISVTNSLTYFNR